MQAWYKAVQELQQRHIADYFFIVLFTGLRRREATDLKWTDVDLEVKTLTVRRDQAKNHKDHVLPLSSFIFDVLKRRFENKSSSPYVFPGRGNRGHLTDFRFALLELREKSGCKFMIHDLRRTFMTAAERLDVPYYVLKKLVARLVASNPRLGNQDV
jgi:integrase